MTNSSYVLSLNRATEHIWISDLKYYITFSLDAGKEDGEEFVNLWIENVISNLPFIGAHKKIEWFKAKYAVHEEEDLLLLLATYSEQIISVIDASTEKEIYGNYYREAYLHS